MTVWYAHREGGKIVFAGTYAQEVYAEEALDDATSAELRAFLNPPPPVPVSVSPLQCRLALNDFGIRAQVEAAVAAGSQVIKDKWEFATEIRRDDPDLNALASAIGLSSAQIDSLFQLAATKA